MIDQWKISTDGHQQLTPTGQLQLQLFNTVDKQKTVIQQLLNGGIQQFPTDDQGQVQASDEGEFATEFDWISWSTELQHKKVINDSLQKLIKNNFNSWTMSAFTDWTVQVVKVKSVTVYDSWSNVLSRSDRSQTA